MIFSIIIIWNKANKLWQATNQIILKLVKYLTSKLIKLIIKLEKKN